MPVRRNSRACDITLDDLEGDEGLFTPPPPYSGRHSEDSIMNPNKKLKKQWTSAALAVNDEEKKKKMEDVIKVWEDQGTTFKEFIDSTTVHGVKHIFEESPYRVRRILWVICFLGALVFFIVQVAIRTTDYFKYKTNVDVQVNYVSSLEFPAVTICNQNSFRMTEVVDMGMYPFVDYVFATDMVDLDMGDYQMYKGVNSTDFLQRTAHQIEDMIDSCYYNTLKCDLTNDFKVTISDMGICYTFNHDPNNIKMVTESGAGYGLRIVLNVEQYQAMRGPQNDAGLKVLLHQQSEFPAVKNLGFSVAPGTHTLVGVYVKQISGIEPPWGICSLSAEPLTNCKRQCKAEMVANSCNCVDAHMVDEGVAGEDGHSHTMEDVCDLPTLWGCVRNVTDHHQTTGDSCNCDIPCNRITYEPRLSYAQLSRINIDRLVLKDEAMSEKVVYNFEQSLETLQRVDESIVSEDEKTLTNLQESITKLETIVDSINVTLGAGSDLQEVLTEMSRALNEDSELVEDFEDDMEDRIKQLDKDKIRVTEFMLGYMYRMLGSPEDAHEGLEGADACVDMMTMSLPYPDETEAEEIIERFTSGMDNKDWIPDYVPSTNESDTDSPSLSPDYCNEYMGGMIEGMQEFYHIMVAAHEYSQSFLESYNEIVHDIYSGTVRNASSIEEHTNCIDYIETKFVPVFDDDVIALVDAFDQIRHSGTKAQLKAALAVLFEEAMTSQVLNYSVWYEDLKDKCWWMDDWMESEDKFEEDLERGEDFFQDAATYTTGAVSQIVKLIEEINFIKSHIDNKISYYTNVTSMYLQGAITKLAMAEAFSAIETSKDFEDLITENADYKSIWDAYEDKVKMIIAHYKMGFVFLLRMELPVIKRQTLDEMRFLNLLKAINESHMQPLIDSIMKDTIASFGDIELFFDATYVEQGGRYQTDMSGAISKITGLVTILRTKMSTYESNAEIDQDFLLNNFLQLDVYYPELSYDLITQHKAFEILSLFSEVGGFLGLLLGASVLSLIELVDYIVMLCTRKWKEKNQVANNGRGVKRF